MKISTGLIIGIIGLIIGILGIVVPVFYDSKKKPEIDTYVEDFTQVISSEKKISGVTIKFNGKEVKNLAVGNIEILNSGGSALVESDFIEPLTFFLKTEGEILDFTLLTKSPNNLYEKATLQNKSTVVIDLKLLNPNDSIVYQLLINGEEPKFEAQARIKNISSVNVFHSNLKDFNGKTNLDREQERDIHIFLRKFFHHHWLINTAFIILTILLIASIVSSFEQYLLRRKINKNKYTFPLRACS